MRFVVATRERIITTIGYLDSATKQRSLNG